ncbi:MAG: hypothetical protein ABI771_04670 [Betaproteobacteria bacterium]
MKRTELAKSKGKKIDDRMNRAPAADRFGGGAAILVDRKEIRKRDRELGLVPFAVKLESDLAMKLRDLAKERNVDLNELVGSLLRKSL